MSHPNPLVESYQHACQGKNCDFVTMDQTDLYNGEYCDACFEYYYCECGRSLGEYEGEGFCKRCQ